MLSQPRQMEKKLRSLDRKFEKINPKALLAQAQMLRLYERIDKRLKDWKERNKILMAA